MSSKSKSWSIVEIKWPYRGNVLYICFPFRWFPVYPVLATVSPGAAYKMAGTMVCLWEAFQYSDYMRKTSLLQALCITQQLFLCLFTERCFSGKKPPAQCFIAEQWKRGNSVPCGHCPRVPQCPFLTSACLAVQQHLLQLTWSSTPGLGIQLFPPRPGRNVAFSLPWRKGTDLSWPFSCNYQISYRPQTGKGERRGWCREMMRWLQMRKV